MNQRNFKARSQYNVGLAWMALVAPLMVAQLTACSGSNPSSVSSSVDGGTSSPGTCSCSFAVNGASNVLPCGNSTCFEGTQYMCDLSGKSSTSATCDGDPGQADSGTDKPVAYDYTASFVIGGKAVKCTNTSFNYDSVNAFVAKGCSDPAIQRIFVHKSQAGFTKHFCHSATTGTEGPDTVGIDYVDGRGLSSGNVAQECEINWSQPDADNKNVVVDVRQVKLGTLSGDGPFVNVTGGGRAVKYE